MVRDEEVLAQLNRIMVSSVFANSARSKQFLEYCVNCSLRGDPSHLKETSIAVDVFLREASYNPKIDPIVRVHARRVREKLEIYYRTTGRRDPITIELPKGSYVPQFGRSAARPEPTIALPEAQSQQTTSPKPESSQHPRRSLFAGVAVLIAALVLTLTYWMRGSHRPHTIELASLKPASALPANVIDAVWSRDGKTVAFTRASEVDGRPYLYTVNLQAGQGPQRLTHGTLAEFRPSWSPDSRQLAFVRMLDAVHFAIVRRDIASGKEEVSRPFITYFPMDIDPPTLDWSPDGTSFLTVEEVSPDTPIRLIRMRIQDGERTYLTSPPIGSTGDVEGKFSPDGRTIAFRRGGLGDLYIVGSDGESNRKAVALTTDNRGVRGIAFTADGKNILFGSHRDASDAFSICSIPVTGGKATPVTPADFEALSPSPVKSDLFSLRHLEVITQMIEVGSDSNTELPTLPGSAVDQAATYAPDGKSIVFISNRSGSEELWLYRRNTAPKQLTHFNGEGFLFTPHWSPDGHLVTFGYRRNGATNVMIYSLESGQMRSLTHTQSRNFNPIFSHDGRYVFFSSNEDGSPRIWRIAVDGKQAAEPLFIQGTSNFAPSPDGQWLYYLDRHEPMTLNRASLQDGTTQEIYRSEDRPAFFNSFVVTREGIYLAVSSMNEQQIRIDRINPNSFQTKTVWKIAAYPVTGALVEQNFDVAPDGSRLLTTHMTDHSSMFFATIR